MEEELYLRCLGAKDKDSVKEGSKSSEGLLLTENG